MRSLLLASIPSPSSGALSLGPLRVTAYGMMIGIGVVAATVLAGRRLERRGAGTREDMGSIATWAVLAGVLGARAYHVATDWSRFSSDPGRIPQIWRGGLGIPGGLAAGILVGVLVGRRRGIAPAALSTAAAPAVPLAQAIGRWGNWWNQELFGRATRLPWALEISSAKLPAGYPPGTTFHPTFLYESLWNVALMLVLLQVDRRFRPPRSRLFAMYLAGYFVGRFWIEGLRIDPAHVIAGLRLNQWVAALVIAGATCFLALDGRRHRSPDGTDAEHAGPGAEPVAP